MDFQKELIERFLRYVKIDTQSQDGQDTTPSTKKQHDLAQVLYKELKEIGARDVYYDKKNCYVYGRIPASKGAKNKKVLGYIAHIDTSDAVSGKDVKPRIVKKYDGRDITLNKALNILLSPKVFPELKNHKGEDLIVTDGTTLLGADDKAGVAEIMTLLSILIKNPEIPHPEIAVCFPPDEEIGHGAELLDLKRMKADYAYTVDGGKLGELEYECFNAASCKVEVRGRSVHPGSAKGMMLNAALVAYEFQAMLPVFENPMYTEGREGFYHLNHIEATCEEACAEYILRDHDKRKFLERKKRVQEIADFLNKKYGKGTVTLTVTDSYTNMVDGIKPHFHLVKNARKAMKALGIEVLEHPIRGGTDGSRLTERGLPCPNLCTGGYNFHGKYEYASVQEMTRTVELLLKIAELYA